MRHDPRDILRDLILTPTLYAESDGFHKCDVFLNVEPPEGFEKLPRTVLIAIGERMPLELWVRDPYGRDGKVVWMDEEQVSLEYAGGGYIVWKRVELP